MSLQIPNIIRKSIVLKDIINVSDEYGRNIIGDPGFDTGDPWNTTGGWTIANGVAHNDGAVGTLSQTIV